MDISAFPLFEDEMSDFGFEIEMDHRGGGEIECRLRRGILVDENGH
jgi:hypothetical protein